MGNFHPKTLVLIGVLVTIAVILTAIAVSMSGKNGGPAVTQRFFPTPTVIKTAVVSFSPESLNFATGSPSATVDVLADAKRGSITGVQVGVTYDPTAVTNVRVLPPDDATSLFGPSGSYNTLFTDTKTLGKISFAVGILPNGKAATGKGSVGKISFTVLRTKPSTQIIFGKTTAVTAPGVSVSVLDYTTPLNINLQ